MAPIGAMLLTVGVSIAIAKAARERLAAWRAAEPELAMLPGERPEQALKRMALEQLDLAVSHLEGEAGVPSERAVHETRKAIKRLRAIFRLLEPALGARALARETETLREVAQRLSAPRDAEVMLATLDGLLERHPRSLGRRGGTRKLRSALAEEHERTCASTLGDPAAIASAVGELLRCRRRVESWQLPHRRQIELLEPGLRRLYRQGRRRFHRAAAGKGGRTLAMHEWRKRVKDLRYVAEMLERRESPAARGPLAAVLPPVHRERPPRPLRELARRADEVGELLGEEHDLAVLAEIVQAAGRERGGPVHISHATRRALLKAIARRRRRLRARALRDGARLYRPGTKKFLERVRASESAR